MKKEIDYTKEYKNKHTGEMEVRKSAFTDEYTIVLRGVKDKLMKDSINDLMDGIIEEFESKDK